jgi:cyclic pyranopterin phosphate synthase
MKTFKVLSINISEKTGEQKKPVDIGRLKADHGIAGDAHAGTGERQVSLLAQEDVDTMKGRGIELHPGDFAENMTTQGVDLGSLPVGTKLEIGECVLEITQIGKKCHHDCAIFKQVGDCVMMRKGIFMRVIKGGTVSKNSKGILLD